jgi:hypothetical protein
MLFRSYKQFSFLDARTKARVSIYIIKELVQPKMSQKYNREFLIWKERGRGV